MTDAPSPPSAARISTGVAGLDAILGGGLAPNRLYLLEGAPGAGKTTLALQFLLESRARGEPTLYVTLSETAEEIATVVESHGWRLDGINLFELASAEAALAPEREMTLLHPWEVELGETIKLITDEVERTGAVRVVFDSLSEMRLLAQDALRFRRQLLALKQFFAQRRTTVLLLDHDTSGRFEQADRQLHSLCHGAFVMQRVTRGYGSARRRLEVAKMRGARFIEGWHDYIIRQGGIEVFPRLIAPQHQGGFVSNPVSSGVAELDAMLDGGPLRGTCTLISGPAGAGKSTLTLQYVHAAANRGEHCAVYQFDERVSTLLVRASRLHLGLEAHIEAGLVELRQIDPAEMSPGEFIDMLCEEVRRNDTRIVVIDSLNGYLTSMAEEKQLILQLHELLSFLNQRGVLTFMVSPQIGFMGAVPNSLSISYIADVVVLVRFFEASGHVRKALSIIKNRGGRHEDSIRELRIDASGVRLGAVLDAFDGVLTGTPSYTGNPAPLLEDRDNIDV